MAGRWKLPECLKTPESMQAFENAMNVSSNLYMNIDANLQTPNFFHSLSVSNPPVPQPIQTPPQSSEAVTRKRVETVKDHQSHLGLPAPHSDTEALKMFEHLVNVPVDFEQIFSPVQPAPSVSVVDVLRPAASKGVNPGNVDA